jgi:S1-C subfamily serine protease
MIVAASLSAGGLVGYWAGYTSTSNQINDLQRQLTTIQEQISNLQTRSETISQNQSDVLEIIDALQAQLSTIRDQIKRLQASNVASQDTSEIMAEISGLRSQLSTLQDQINNIKATVSVTYENITYILGENAPLSQLFEQVRESVVVIQAFSPTATVQGSGFVYNYSGQMIILTNNHVIENAITINVTFASGNTYTVLHKDSNPNTDVALLTISAPQSEYKPLVIVNSSTLKVGDPVIVVGTPYGLEGSMSNGIISALNRTITTDQITLTNIIQTTAPLNPGNSGGPLMNYMGQVVGMATAIVEDSQGIGFAIPSDTILQEIMEIMN